MASWTTLAWSWSADEIIDSPTADAALPPPPPPPKRSRKKKLKFVECESESLNRQFLKIAAGEEKVRNTQKKTFFFLPFFFSCFFGAKC